MYVIQFRIPFQNPFGKLSYHHGACASSRHLKKGDKILVSDREGNMSCNPAEVHCVSRAGKFSHGYDCVFIGEMA